MKKVFVLGGINMDYIIHVNGVPKKGESKPGHSFTSCQGGKGANQAIASKRLGCDKVYLMASIGDDHNGKVLKEEMEKNGIDTSGFQINGDMSGTCMITIDDNIKDNFIIVNDASNMKIDPNKIEEFLENNANSGDIFITQLENNLDAIYTGLRVSKSKGLFTIFNPAPATILDEEIYKYVDVIIPNESECKSLTGLDILNIDDKRKVFEYFNYKGVKEVIVTLGSNGSIYFNKDKTIKMDKVNVNVIDTTSAGDTFIGALASTVYNGGSIKDGLLYSTYASAITVSRQGSGKSIPNKKEVTNFMNQSK